MDFSNAAHLAAIVATIAALANFVMMLVIKAAISEVKTELADARRKDAAEYRDWVDRNFQRREVSAR